MALLNDIHMNLTYNEDCTFPYCYSDGKYGMDSPSTLVDFIIDDLHD